MLQPLSLSAMPVHRTMITLLLDILARPSRLMEIEPHDVIDFIQLMMHGIRLIEEHTRLHNRRAAI